jgi:DNA-binding transcriptional LysR family regulator
MDRLEAMSVVIAVTETGSFSAASRRLGTPVATVSRKVSELEARLKAELFQRSSRRMTLTDAGQSYIEACKRIIEQVDDAEREVSGEYRVPKGDLAVTAPWGLGHMHLLPMAVEFMNAYPDIALRLVLTDRVVNAVEENIDVSIRIGVLPESSMIATRIGSVRLVVCASPSYLAAHGTPMEPGDLRGHDCITVDNIGALSAWRFAQAGRTIVAPIRSRLCVNTSEAAIQAAIAGAGLTRVMSYKMEEALRAGTLRVFLTWAAPRLKARLAPYRDD